MFEDHKRPHRQELRSPASALTAEQVSTAADRLLMPVPPGQARESPVATPTPELRPELQRHQLASKVQAVLLAGGQSCIPVASTRAVAALPLGANLRLLDIPVASLLSSGINKLHVLAQYNAHSLISHAASSYTPSFGAPHVEAFVDVVACSQTRQSEEWYRGSAEAVGCNLQQIDERVSGMASEDFIITSGNHVYELDFLELVNTHRCSGADITIVTSAVPKASARSMGVVLTDPATGLVTHFAEKPSASILQLLAHGSAHTSPAAPFAASLGTYIFRRGALLELLGGPRASGRVHFGRDVIPTALSFGLRVAAHHYSGPWRAIQTLTDYHAANLALAGASEGDGKSGMGALESLYANPPRTQSVLPPPSLQGGVTVDACLLGDGSVVQGSSILRSVLGRNSYVAPGCVLEDSVLLGNASYYTAAQRVAAAAAGTPLPGIGSGTTLRRAVVDTDAVVGTGVLVHNRDGVQEADRSEQGWVVREGLVVVLANAVIPDGTHI